MGLTITVLGCAGGFPGPDDACSGYLVEGGGVRVVFDLGPGTMANLQHHIGLADLDAVVLSHQHPDHWVDFAVLNTAFTYELLRTDAPVYGTPETRAAATAVLGDLSPTWAWTDIADGDTIRIGGLTVDFRQTEHYVTTLASRATDGERSVAYSADTGPGWSFASFGAPIDLAVCEATMRTEQEIDGVLHLSARQAGEMCRAAGVRSLVLTHFPVHADRAVYEAAGSAAFGAPVGMASTHARFGV